MQTKPDRSGKLPILHREQKRERDYKNLKASAIAFQKKYLVSLSNHGFSATDVKSAQVALHSNGETIEKYALNNNPLKKPNPSNLLSVVP
jgi:hypothetical protein